jgi:hypothetical protein
MVTRSRRFAAPARRGCRRTSPTSEPEALYTEHLDTLEKYEFDPAPAGAERMGSEAKFLVASGDHGLLHAVFQDDLLRALASDMDGCPSGNIVPLSAYRAGFA